jgi:hypothetical protein
MALAVLSLGLVNAAPVHVAIWDPQFGTKEMRFTLDLPGLDQTAKILATKGCDVSRLTSAQLNDPSTFSATKFDVLILPGDVFPVPNVPAIKSFADGGGVLVALGTNVPFLIAIEPEADGYWTMAPKTPQFAWQRKDISDVYGLKYIWRPNLHDSGAVHDPSPLLLQYLPTAKTIRRTLPSRWIISGDGAKMYPLLGSRRPDGVAVSPQIYIAQKGAHTAIIAAPRFNTTGVAGFALPDDTIAALVKIGGDIKRGIIHLDPASAINLPADMPSPGPLEMRVGSGSVNPDGAASQKRWGKFDGSCVDLPQNAMPDALPRNLQAGKSATLVLPSSPPSEKVAQFFRIRAAYVKTGAGLKVAIEDGASSRVLWNETLNYIDTRGTSNHNAIDDIQPIEFNRVIFLPPASATARLVVTNAGIETLYLDAAQIEVHKAPTPARFVGVGAGPPYPDPKYTQQWAPIRTSLRTQYVGPPGDPKRWDKMDQKIDDALKANPRIQGIIEGTPAWAAASPERLAEAEKARRPSTVAPDREKYIQMLSELVARYGDKIAFYEIWNEPDLQQYWRGSQLEYIEFFKSAIETIRKGAPKAVVVAGGLSGANESWVRGMVEAGVLPLADVLAFHPYAGKTPAWDARYGTEEGALYSCGIGTELYCDESGFPFNNAEWFQPPPFWTPQLQARYTDIAFARLLGTGVAKLQIFIAGPNSGPYDVFETRDTPRPAYSVVDDYLALSRNDGHMEYVSLTAPDGAALQGTYVAAASHPDGSVDIVVNPAEVAALHPEPLPVFDFDTIAGWTTFFGKATASAGKVTVTPADGKAYAGFYQSVSVDPLKTPIIEVNVPQSDAGYDLVLKLPDGKKVDAATGQHGGIWTGDLRKLLPPGAKEFELSFRVNGPTVFDSVHFGADPLAPTTAPVSAASVPVRLLVPLSGKVPYSAKATCSGAPVAVKSTLTTSAGLSYADVTLSLTGRTVVTLTPSR